MPKLGVNIDHIATLRQARREFDPDPVAAARICEKAGADSIVAHLREDRRHINDHDIRRLRRSIKTRFNLEMSLNDKIIRIARRIRPDEATLVPEKREEITTEGGLDVIRHFSRVAKAVTTLQKSGITVSLFINPARQQIMKAAETGATVIELHTGSYDLAKTIAARKRALKKLSDMTAYARGLGLSVNAGHGLKYHNTRAVARIPGMEELNIGHAIISRAVFVGLAAAVHDMIKIIKGQP
ncbi:MAG TPA: pyridoxine 5'-phosphate synthase [Candidatus Omnitrophota bacterium]|nr:pyridoxine 5'-phosphate synthase [Candidatus Omnitrophota bacterium]